MLNSLLLNKWQKPWPLVSYTKWKCNFQDFILSKYQPNQRSNIMLSTSFQNLKIQDQHLKVSAFKLSSLSNGANYNLLLWMKYLPISIHLEILHNWLAWEFCEV